MHDHCGIWRGLVRGGERVVGAVAVGSMSRIEP